LELRREILRAIWPNAYAYSDFDSIHNRDTDGYSHNYA
jgi:hypothetical protein